MRKRLLSLVLAFVMVLSLVPVTALAAADAAPEKITLVGSDAALLYESGEPGNYWGTEVPLYKVYVPAGTTTVQLHDSKVYLSSSYGSGYCSLNGLANSTSWSKDTVGSSSPYTIETRMSGETQNLSFVKHASYVGSSSDGYLLQFEVAKDPSAAPTISKDLSTSAVNYTYGDAAQALSVTASGNGTVSYQWEVSTTSASDGFAAIENANTSSYTPATNAVGDFWYRVVVTNTEKDKSPASVTSAVTPVKVTAPEGKSHVQFKTSIGHSNSRPMTFTLSDSEKKPLAVTADTSSGYAVYDFWAAPGEYTYKAVDTKDGTAYTLGTGTFTVTDSSDLQEYELYLTYVYASMSGWTAEDFTTEVKDSGTVMKPGDPYKFASYVAYPYLMAPGSYTYSIIPSAARAAEGYQSVDSKSKTLSAVKDGTTWSDKLTQIIATTFTVPKGAGVTVTTQPAKPYVDGAAVDGTANTEGKDADVWTFSLTAGSTYVYRASGEDLVTTTGNLTASSAAKSLDLTETMTGDPQQVTRTGDLDTADLRLSGVDNTGSLSLAVGGTQKLTPMRMWQIMNNSYATNTSAYTMEPDFHYTVVDETGKASDVVSVNRDGTIKANKAGTALVLVTYDALHVGTCGWSVNSNKTFSAIWPENTGVVVVTVDGKTGPGTDALTINTATTTNGSNKLAGTKLDAELDVLYCTDTQPATYTFSVADGSEVTLLRPTLGESGMTYSGGFSTTGVAVDEDEETATLTLAEGKNIVKLSKDGGDSYQVISVKKTTPTITNKSNPGIPIQPGDTVEVQLDVTNPANRMASLYNLYNVITYTDPGSSTTVSGTKLTGNYGSPADRYQFDESKGAAARTITVTIPFGWDTDTPYVLTNGVMTLSGNGKPVGSHRNDLSALASSTPSCGTFTLGQLPDITIPVQGSKSVTFNVKDGSENTVEGYKVSLVRADGTTTVLDTASDGYTRALPYGTWTYTVHKTGYQPIRGTLTLDDKAEQVQTVSLTAIAAQGGDKAWDGLAATEPTKTDDGIYQIGTGAELAWLAQYVNGGNSSASQPVKAVLTADIDLAGYDWAPIGGGADKKTFYGSFDGQGHTVSGLYIDQKDTSNLGLFGSVSGYGVSGGSSIKNLTVEGSVTATDTKSKSGGYTSMDKIAGIVGNATETVTIENCVNKADVSVYVYSVLAVNAGGVVGYAQNAVALKNCGNKGDITGVADGMLGYHYGGRIGGIAGQTSGSSSKTVTITGCYNTGDIYSTGPAGGIVGWVYDDHETLQDVYNTGNVTGGDRVGGIVGYLSKSKVVNAYSTTVPIPEASANMEDRWAGIGGIVGNGGGATLTNVYYFSGTQNALDAIGNGEPADGSTVYSKSLAEIQSLSGSDLGGTFTTDATGINGGYPILLWQANITGIQVKTLPNKTVYTAGDTLDITGLVVEGTVDGKPVTLGNAALTISPMELNTVGDAIPITVSYGSFSDTFTVKVNKYVPPAPETIRIETDLTNGATQKNSRRTFDVIARDASGDKVPVSKLTVKLNGQVVAPNWDDDVKTSYTLKFTQEGENTVTITALTKTVTYTIHYEKAAPGEVVGQAVFSMETFSLGGGYLIAPCYVDIIEGENGAEMLKRVLEENDLTMKYTGSLSSSFYLSSVTGEAVTQVDPTGDSIPAALKKKLGSVSQRNDKKKLGEFDYTSGSGWMYCVNKNFPNVGFSDCYLADSDVLRVQFTLAIGQDIGGGYSTGGSGNGSYYAIADKDELTTLIADVGIQKVPKDVLAVATELYATQAEVNAAVKTLKSLSKNEGTGSGVGKTEDVVTTLTPSAKTDSSGTAKAEVTEKAVTEGLKQAEKDGASALEIKPSVQGEASTVSVSVPEKAVDKVAGQKLDLQITTPVATVKLPDQAVEELSKASGDLAVQTTKNQDGTVAVDVSVGGQKKDTVSGGIVVKIPAENVSSTCVLAIVAEDGTEQIVKKSLTEQDGVVAQLSGSAVVKLVDNKQDFDDVADHWGKSAIDFATSRGLFNGVSKTSFAPQETMTRAMLATTLFRLEDAVAQGDNTFKDVPDDTWYTDAVTWCSANKIVEGTGKGFDPDGSITREQLATMFYRYADLLDLDTTAAGDIDRFADGGTVSSWAEDAVAWAVGVGLLQGKGADKLDPNGAATRAEVATLYQRLISLIVA